MRVTLDGTPLLGARTGIGTYTENLIRALVARYPDDEWAATAFTLRGRGELPVLLPNGVAPRTRPMSARALHTAWLRFDMPPAEAICGSTDIFHATNFVLPPLSRARGVVTVHDLAYLRYPRTVTDASLAYQELVPRSLRRAGAVCVVSQAMANQLLEAYRYPAERVVVTPLAVDRNWFDARPASADRRRALGLPDEYVLAVGTLEPRKNLGVLVDIWRRHPDLPPLVLVGGAGWGKGLDLSGMTPGRIVLTGRIQYSDLLPVVAGASLLAFPSIDEGFGLPPLEALATGTPVVAADIPVTHEVLGTQATFANPLDVDEFAVAITRSLDAPIGTAGSRRARAAEFSWARCAEQTYVAYQTALG